MVGGAIGGGVGAFSVACLGVKCGLGLRVMPEVRWVEPTVCLSVVAAVKSLVETLGEV